MLAETSVPESIGPYNWLMATGFGRGYPAHLPLQGVRVLRASHNYDTTVAFYRDVVGLTVLDVFGESDGGDATVFGLPDTSFHLEITRVRQTSPRQSATSLEYHLVFYLGESPAVARAMRYLAAGGAHPGPNPDPYWDSRRAVTYRDPDGCGVILVPWVYGQPSVI